MLCLDLHIYIYIYIYIDKSVGFNAPDRLSQILATLLNIYS